MTLTSSSFSQADFEMLDAWLLRRGKGICDIVELEGFFTANVIGLNTLSPLKWLPRVWGGRQPRFRDLDELNQFTALVMGFYNDIALAFEQAPEQFTPTFYESKVDGKRVRVVDEWCVGFLKGMRLDTAGWRPLKRERPDLLKPLQLFGSPAGWRELEAGGEAKNASDLVSEDCARGERDSLLHRGQCLTRDRAALYGCGDCILRGHAKRPASWHAPRRHSPGPADYELQAANRNCLRGRRRPGIHPRCVLRRQGLRDGAAASAR